MAKAYVRKTEDEFRIMADHGYGDGWELETTETNRKDAKEQIKIYRQEAPQARYKLVKCRVKINPPVLTT